MHDECTHVHLLTPTNMSACSNRHLCLLLYDAAVEALRRRELVERLVALHERLQRCLPPRQRRVSVRTAAGTTLTRRVQTPAVRLHRTFPASFAPTRQIMPVSRHRPAALTPLSCQYGAVVCRRIEHFKGAAACATVADNDTWCAHRMCLPPRRRFPARPCGVPTQ
jgi:hypothetical protein